MALKMESSPANRIPAGSSIREYDGPLPRGLAIVSVSQWYLLIQGLMERLGNGRWNWPMDPDGEGCVKKGRKKIFLDMANSPRKSLRLHKADGITEWDYLPSNLANFLSSLVISHLRQDPVS